MNYLKTVGDLVNHFEVDPVVVGELIDRRWHERILWGIPLPNQSFLVVIKRIHMRVQDVPPGFHDTLDRSKLNANDFSGLRDPMTETICACDWKSKKAWQTGAADAGAWRW